MTRRSILVLTAAVALLTSACSSNGGGSQASTTATTAVSTTTEPSTAPGSTTTQPGSTTTVPDTTTTSAPVIAGNPDYRWQVGDCFSFGSAQGLEFLPYAPFGDRQLVGCDEVHTHEVYVASTVPWGVEDSFPGQELSDYVGDTCARGFVDTYGVVLAASQLDIILYLPDADEWEQGLRYVGCVSFLPGRNATYIPVTGRFSDDPDAVRWDVDVGDCLGGDGFVERPAVVDCDALHAFQVVAITELDEDAAFPSQLDFDDLQEGCDAALAGVDQPPRGTVVSFISGFSESDWDLGYRRIVCIAAAISEVGELYRVEGSFTEEWTTRGVFRSDEGVTA